MALPSEFLECFGTHVIKKPTEFKRIVESFKQILSYNANVALKQKRQLPKFLHRRHRKDEPSNFSMNPNHFISLTGKRQVSYNEGYDYQDELQNSLSLLSRISRWAPIRSDSSYLQWCGNWQCYNEKQRHVDEYWVCNFLVRSVLVEPVVKEKVMIFEGRKF